MASYLPSVTAGELNRKNVDTVFGNSFWVYLCKVFLSWLCTIQFLKFIIKDLIRMIDLLKNYK